MADLSLQGVTPLGWVTFKRSNEAMNRVERWRLKEQCRGLILLSSTYHDWYEASSIRHICPPFDVRYD